MLGEVAAGVLDERQVGQAVTQGSGHADHGDVEALEAGRVGRREVALVQRPRQFLVGDVADVALTGEQRLDPLDRRLESDDREPDLDARIATGSPT